MRQSANIDARTLLMGSSKTMAPQKKETKIATALQMDWATEMPASCTAKTPKTPLMAHMVAPATPHHVNLISAPSRRTNQDVTKQTGSWPPGDALGVLIGTAKDPKKASAASPARSPPPNPMAACTSSSRSVEDVFTAS
eukprot:scaffold967_cov321-Pavlova_lutheri.AAC.25